MLESNKIAPAGVLPNLAGICRSSTDIMPRVKRFWFQHVCMPTWYLSYRAWIRYQPLRDQVNAVADHSLCYSFEGVAGASVQIHRL